MLASKQRSTSESQAPPSDTLKPAIYWRLFLHSTDKSRADIAFFAASTPGGSSDRRIVNAPWPGFLRCQSASAPHPGNNSAPVSFSAGAGRRLSGSGAACIGADRAGRHAPTAPAARIAPLSRRRPRDADDAVKRLPAIGRRPTAWPPVIDGCGVGTARGGARGPRRGDTRYAGDALLHRAPVFKDFSFLHFESERVLHCERASTTSGGTRGAAAHNFRLD